MQLEIKHFHLSTRHRPGTDKVGGRDPDLVSAGILRHQAKVAREQLHRREAAGFHIVGRFGRVFGLFPFVFVPVEIVVPIIGVGRVPFLFVRGAWLADGLCGEHRLLAAVEALVQTETQAYAINGPGLLAEETAQVDAMVVPLVQVEGCIQRNVALVDQAPAAAEVVLTAEVIVLQEHQYILLVDFHHPDLHC